MGVSLVVFHVRPPLRFSPLFPLTGLGNLLPLSSSRLCVGKPAKAWPPLWTTTTGRGRLDESRGRKVGSRAHLAEDAPFAIAIGACILNSLVFPVPSGPDDAAEDSGSGGSGIDSTDTRFAVMGILSFIPYFNWMSWIFAWLDTGRQRYLLYSIVYLAPYLRTNLSLSPNDSWLPIASILACIAHIQLEASIGSGEINGFPMLEETLKHLFPAKTEVGGYSQRHKDIHDEEESKKELGEREVWQKSIDDRWHLKDKKDLNEDERN